tara:strand:- start:838 stop:1662 length:825 start_codon:yes stop_codon:yes gene_type:complete
MNLDELTPAPSAKKINNLAKRVFGYALDLENISEQKAKRLHKNLSAQMNIYESQMGSKAQTRSKYYEMKLALEALTKHIEERKVDEEDVEEANEFVKARLDAIKAGKSEFTIDGKTYKVTGDTSQEKKQKTTESVVTEGAVESSELVMAAKSMVDKYDAMIQDIGEMLNEQLTPLVDKIRDEMGSDIAEQYLATMTDALNATMNGMKEDRMIADDASRILTGEAPAAPMGEPMDAPMDEIPADEVPLEPIEDEFATADAAVGGEEAPVGREKRA